MDILTKEEIDLLERQTSFRVAEVIKVGLERAYNLAVEKTLCGLPDLLVHLAKRTESMQKMYSDFFEKHPELAKEKTKVAEVIQSLELRNPGATPEEILKMVPGAFGSYQRVSEKVKTTDLDLATLDSSINGAL